MSVLDSRGSKNSRSPIQTICSPEIKIKEIVLRFYLDRYPELTPEERTEYLETLNGLDIFDALTYVKNELATIRLENYVLNEFLEIYDAKLLSGLKQRLSTKQKLHKFGHLKESSQGSESGTSSRQSSARRTPVNLNTTLRTKLKHKETYNLNFKAKYELAAKSMSMLQKRIEKFETNTMKHIKNQRAVIEELQSHKNDSFETLSSFKLHFVKDDTDLQFLHCASERQLEGKFRRYMQHWFKTARGLIVNIRLKTSSTHDRNMQFQQDLMQKTDLRGILNSVDFQLLLMRYGTQDLTLDEQQNITKNLKFITGRISLEMAAQKMIIRNIEIELKVIVLKLAEIRNSIIKLRKEKAHINEANANAREYVNSLKQKLFDYVSPSVNDYMVQKDLSEALNKEAKTLLRKISILQIQWKNLQAKQQVYLK